MPTYEYKREDGTVFEKLQGINDAPLTECPETGQPVRRIISGGAGVVYKGTGFYVTDYKNGNGTAKKSPEGSSENTESSKEAAPKADKE
ncbi:MAG: zinc ribbon domain-containing protein [Balneolaceae bacterium]|nr:MAG: zinc ribbon domain-containing protein [Balneolaceae bacterium]